MFSRERKIKGYWCLFFLVHMHSWELEPSATSLLFMLKFLGLRCSTAVLEVETNIN